MDGMKKTSPLRTLIRESVRHSLFESAMREAELEKSWPGHRGRAPNQPAMATDWSAMQDALRQIVFETEPGTRLSFDDIKKRVGRAVPANLEAALMKLVNRGLLIVDASGPERVFIIA